MPTMKALIDGELREVVFVHLCFRVDVGTGEVALRSGESSEKPRYSPIFEVLPGNEEEIEKRVEKRVSQAIYDLPISRELQEFLEGNMPEADADPKFKERLRMKLLKETSGSCSTWDLIHATFLKIRAALAAPQPAETEEAERILREQETEKPDVDPADLVVKMRRCRHAVKE